MNTLKKLKRADLRNIKGGVIKSGGSIKNCGCDCAGQVTGPSYCDSLISCLQIYSC